MGAGVFAATKAGDSSKSKPASAGHRGEIFLQPVSTAGTHPYTPAVGRDEHVTPPSTAARSGGGTPTLQSYTGDTVGLYGGTRSSARCDPNQLVTFLQQNPDKAAAWASTLGVPTSGIRGYVAKLTPVILRADTRVTNHGFDNGKATVIPAVLQAGTSVLVDQFGTPRVKCYCGNPLTTPEALSQPVYTGPAWPAFSPATTVVAVPAPAPVRTFTLVDVKTGQPFSRPAGSAGTRDANAPAGTKIAFPPPDTATTAVARGTTTTATHNASTTTTPDTTATTTPDTTATTTSGPTTTTTPTANIASQGATSASSVSKPAAGFTFEPAKAVDNDTKTSWFSAGAADGNDSTYTWQAPRDALIRDVVIVGNADNANPDWRTGFGFSSVTIRIVSSTSTVAFTQDVDFGASKDPNATVHPNVIGRSVVLVFHVHQSPDCGGFSELRVFGSYA